MVWVPFFCKKLIEFGNLWGFHMSIYLVQPAVSTVAMPLLEKVAKQTF